MISVILRGGLGNQLYQIAVAYAYAKKYKMEYCIPVGTNEPHYEGQQPYIFPGITYCKKPHKLERYTESGFHYEEPPPRMKNIAFDGYFQSEKYFEGYREELIERFGFKWEKREGWISLHVRRGDYLLSREYHPVMPLSYFSKAIQHYMERGYSKFLVFSDDIGWCRENININRFPTCEFEYSEGRTEIEDLELGSNCMHQIMSNSSFSVWQHILNRNKNKTCAAPSVWFGENVNFNTKDVYPTTSIII